MRVEETQVSDFRQVNQGSRPRARGGIHLAHDSDTNGFWQAETIVCQACAAIADEGKNGEQTPGTTVNVRLDPDYQPRLLNVDD